MKRRKVSALLLCLALIVSLIPTAALALEPTDGYVLMNIPYEEFYAAEAGGFDTVTTATLKFENKSVAGGSYHETDAATDTESHIGGVIYPVYVSDLSSLDAALEVTDETVKTINLVTGREKTVTATEVSGADALFCAPSYSWYRLADVPSRYKTVTVNGDVYSFGAVSGEAATAEVTATVSYDTHHGNEVEIKVDGTGIESSDIVGGVIVSFNDGSTLGLPHVQGIWSRTQIGFPELGELAGKTITNIRYITREAVIDCAVDILLSGADNRGYVLMNIPYAEFYAGEGVENVDAVTSATLNKPRTGTLAGGSYHVNADGSDISGVIYPVFVQDMSVLAGLTKITDDSSVSITVTNRGRETSTDYTGKDALFEAPDHSYYLLTEVPARYKTLTVKDGNWSFGAVSGRATTVENAIGEVTVGGRHADVEIKLSGTTGIDQGDAVSGVVLTFSDDTRLGLKHIENLWRATELGGSVSELSGKTITNIRYITQTDVIDYPVNISVEDAVYALMNIPYAEFYAAENAVDAISSATLNGKARNVNVNGASYHQSEEAATTEGIAGVMYPVFATRADLAVLGGREITDESAVSYEMSARGQTSTVTLAGKDALQEAPSYSYYVLGERPASFKKLTVTDGVAAFAAASGRAASGTAEGTVTVGGRHADIEISLSGVEVTPTDVSAVVITTAEGSYALHHVVNIWRGTEIGWNLNDLDLGDRTITGIRYYFKDGGLADYAADIEISRAGYVLMNIPYTEFYAGEGVENVDAVTSATKKAYNSGLVAGSYHGPEDETYASTDILGVTYPVFVADLSALLENEAVVPADGQTAAEALFAAGDHAYVLLEDAPNVSKKLTINDGAYGFSAASARASALSDVTAAVTVLTKRGDYEIKLSGDNASVLSGGTVYGVVLTATDGETETKYALRHLENIWKGVELAFCTGHTETIKDGALKPNSEMYAALEGQTVTGITYYVKDAEGVYRTCTISAELAIPAYPTASFTGDSTVAISGLSEAELEAVAVNADSGEAKYYSATVSQGDTILAEKVPVAADGTIALTVPAFASGDYSVEVIQTNTKKGEDAVFLSLTAAYAGTEAFDDGEDVSAGGNDTGTAGSDTDDTVPADEDAEAAKGEISIAAEITEEGVASAAVNADTVTDVISQAESAGTLTVAVVSEDASAVALTLEAEAMQSIADAETDLAVETAIGSVTLAADAVKTLAAEEKEVVVSVVANEDGSTTVDVALDGETADITVKAGLPATEGSKVLVIVYADGTEEVVKKSMVDGDTVYASLPAGTTVKTVDNAKDFDDVGDTWYTEYVDFVSSHELFEGTDEGVFEPNANMTRAMMVTVLYRLESEPESNGSRAFSNVAADKWYSDAVAWAVETGITDGYEDGSFGVSDNVTREQIAAFMYRYMFAIGGDVSGTGSVEAFTDGSEVSPWASEAMSWAVGVGLFEGDGNGSLNPKGDATRAEVAALMARLVKLIVS